jgi:hypothetical protein
MRARVSILFLSRRCITISPCACKSTIPPLDNRFQRREGRNHSIWPQAKPLCSISMVKDCHKFITKVIPWVDVARSARKGIVRACCGQPAVTDASQQRISARARPTLLYVQATKRTDTLSTNSIVAQVEGHLTPDHHLSQEYGSVNRANFEGIS